MPMSSAIALSSIIFSARSSDSEGGGGSGGRSGDIADTVTLSSVDLGASAVAASAVAGTPPARLGGCATGGRPRLLVGDNGECCASNVEDGASTSGASPSILSSVSSL